MAESFGEMTRRFRICAGLSMGRLARAAGIDPAYVMRIERGVHQSPSRDVVLGLAGALKMSPQQVDRYLFAAGLAPNVDWQSRAEDYEARLIAVRDAVDEVVLPSAPEAYPFIRRPAS